MEVTPMSYTEFIQTPYFIAMQFVAIWFIAAMGIAVAIEAIKDLWRRWHDEKQSDS